MKQRLFVFFAAAALLAAGCGKPAGVLKTSVPVRPAGQQDVIGLTAEPLETVHIGIVGIGMRGSSAVSRLARVPGAEIVALCDLLPDRVEDGQAALAALGKPAASGTYSGAEESWKGLCEQADVDLVYICTDWMHHYPIAMYAMECGKHVAIEVPAALDLDEIWGLINQSEKTRRHCMMLENCVYDFFEMTTLEMARRGLFGEVIHVEGAYCHNLDPYWDEYWNDWRMDYNRKHRGDVYPTHGIGPVCQVLNIHRGDRMTTLVSMDTKSFNGAKIASERYGEEVKEFANGDETSTLIRTEKGKTILIEHDVMTPRPYSRMYQVVGTEGYASKYPVSEYCLRTDEPAGEKSYRGAEMEALQAGYRNVILTPEFEELAKSVGGHGGMDFIMDYRLVYCLRHGLPLDMDVYDLAEWCSVAPLSRLSLENGSMPVEVPDFTRGAWDRVQGFRYALAE
uniref:Glycosyl hydrolase family 109 protein 1 n=1 Tax=uncultured bacterium Contig39 TaxID=1393565 RepID=W0FRF8_9BACT|nr:glycosyl hydrolase family 109 protein 1 [uncultured bacterium Contig39]